MIKNIFKEDIRLQGNDKMGFLSALEAFHRESRQIKIDPDSLCLCSIYRVTRNELWIVKTDIHMATFSNLYTQIMTGNQSDQAAYDFFRVPKSRFYEMGLDDDDIKEAIREGAYFEYEGQTIVLSPKFLYHLARVLSISAIPHGMNPIRELFLANQLYDFDPFYITVRKKKDAFKAFYASINKNCSDMLSEICKTVLRSMLKKGAEIYEWVITHEKTEICFTYPEYTTDGFQFGVVFCISDVGEHAITLSNAVVVQSTIYWLKDAILSKRNFGTFNVHDFLEEFEEMTKGYLKSMKDTVASLPVADTGKVEEIYRLLNLSRKCGKKLTSEVKTLVLEKVKSGETENKGLAPILNLPVILKEMEIKDYIISYFIKAIEDFVNDLVRPEK